MVAEDLRRQNACALVGSLDNISKLNFFQIRMLLRLTPLLGGDGTVHGIIAMNDTGSDILSLFTTDLLQLGNIQGYTGRQAPTITIDANGGMTSFSTILVQVRLVRDDNTPWGDWIDEAAIIRQPSPGVSRLSGGWTQKCLVHRYCTRQSSPGCQRH
jgi:hypothetical protein